MSQDHRHAFRVVYHSSFLITIIINEQKGTRHTYSLLQVPSSRLVERDLLLRLQSLGQLIEPREARLYLLKGRVARGDAPTNVLQLLRLRREGGQL